MSLVVLRELGRERAGGGRPPAAPADTWLRRLTAAVGCLLLLAAFGGSAADPDPGSPAGSAAGSTATATPAPPSPAPAVAPLPVLAPVDPADPAAAPAPPTAAAVARAVGGLLADPRLGPRVSAVVLDGADGRVLLDRAADQAATPASTAKLLTAAATLATARSDDRIVTRVVAGARRGEIVLVGAGDPTLSTAPRGSPARYPGAGRIADLAAAVRRSGVGRVTRVVVDGSLYSGPVLAPGWPFGDVTAGYVAPITAVMADGGRDRPDQPGSSTDPDLAAGRALAAALRSPAAEVVRGRPPAGARVLGKVRSAPLLRLVEQMLQESDNVLAEALARQVALAERQPASFAGAATAVRQVLARLGLRLGDLTLVDGSGLSPFDRLSPAVLAGALGVALRPEHPALHGLVAALPMSGFAGTLNERYLTGPSRAGAGRVRAKTGTLDGVSALAGVTSDRGGRLLVFAVLADQVPIGGTLAAEAALDQVAAALSGCRCG